VTNKEAMMDFTKVEIPLLGVIEQLREDMDPKDILNRIGDSLSDKGYIDVFALGTWRITDRGKKLLDISRLRTQKQLEKAEKFEADIQSLKGRLVERAGQTRLRERRRKIEIIDAMMVGYAKKVEISGGVTYKDDSKSRKNVLKVLDGKTVVFNRMSPSELRKIAGASVNVISRSSGTKGVMYAAVQLEDIDVESLISTLRVYTDRVVQVGVRITHHILKDNLLKLGKARGFEAHPEYRCGGYRLDVVWQDKVADNPTHCFQVHIRGSRDNALNALKHSHHRWRADTFLVCTEDEVEKCKNILSGALHKEGGLKINILLAEEVVEYCNVVKRLKHIDEFLGR